MRLPVGLADLVRRQILLRRRYFKEAHHTIAAYNRWTLTIASAATVILLLAFLLLADLMIEGWRPSVYHLAFLPVSLLFLALVLLSRRWNLSERAVTGLCFLFEIVMLFFVTCIDTLADPTAPSAFMPLMSIVLVALFILPERFNYGLLLVSEIIYLAMTAHFKFSRIVQHDLFDAVAGFLCALVIGQIIFSLRLRDYESERRYRQLSSYDVLSGLLNKHTCTETIIRHLQATSPHTRCLLAVVDLDNFKTVNDTHGHAVGDQVLSCMGRALLSVFPAPDIVGRFGGDEFLLLSKECVSPAQAEERLAQIGRIFRQLTLHETGLTPSCSVGAVLIEDQQADFEAVFKQADTLLYRAKRAGKNLPMWERWEGTPDPSPVACPLEAVPLAERPLVENAPRE